MLLNGSNRFTGETLIGCNQDSIISIINGIIGVSNVSQGLFGREILIDV